MKIDTDVTLLKYRRTKIVATLGPASCEAPVIRNLITAGVDVFRLNMSHGTHADHERTFGLVREASRELGKPVAVLADLCGPKIRVGSFSGGGIDLASGKEVLVTTREVEGGPGLIESQYRDLHRDVSPGARLLLDDGNLELLVEKVEGTEIRCRVIAGGRLSNHKGMNLPGIRVSAPSLTPVDREDARFALSLGVDFLALSFVREGDDVRALRALCREENREARLIAKIEKPEALDHISDIMEASDGIMVARGDLGVELPPQKVPYVQDRLIDMARFYRIPVIVATQMLESMIVHPRPTRAEVSDVSTAVGAGADAVMLSAETAAGKYPVAAASMMDSVARQTEATLWLRGAFASLSHGPPDEPPLHVEDALAKSTGLLSRDLLVRAIVVISREPHSLSIMSAARPAAPIVGVSPDPAQTRAGTLLWGVIPLTAGAEEMEDPRAFAKKSARELNLAGPGQTLLMVRGFSGDPEQNAPSVTVLMV